MVDLRTIIDELNMLARHAGYHSSEVADRIESEGIAPPDGLVLVPKALQAKPEPVAYIPQAALEAFVEGTVSGVRVWRTKDESVGDVPLYTTPPSVDALIAEAVAKEREACALVCESNYGTMSQFANRIDCTIHNSVIVDCAKAIRAKDKP